MSVELSSGNYLSRTGGVPASHQAFSCCAWVKRASDAAQDEYIIHFGTGTNPIQIKVEHDDNKFTLNLQYSGSRIVSGPTATVGSWFFVGLICSGTTATLYWRAEGETSLSSGSASNTGSDWTTNNIYLGRDAGTTPFNPFAGKMACFRVWDAAITVGELTTESESLTAVKTTGLLSDHRFDGANIAAAVEDDHSSNNDFTATGTVTVSVDEPTVTAGGATDELAGGDDLPVISSIDLSPTNVSLIVGDDQTMALMINDQDDVALPYLTGVSASSATAVATVTQPAATNAAGEATFLVDTLQVGTASITVALDGVTSNAAAVTVTAQPVSGTVNVVPATVSMVASTLQQFTAELLGEPGAAFTWTVPSGGGSISATGLYTAPGGAGSATVRATLTADATVYGQASVTITALPAGSIQVTTTWLVSGSPYASQNLDYVVKSATNVVITSGTLPTNASGVLTVAVPDSYSGSSVLIQVENVGSDMVTTGKFHGAQVVAVP
jgi:hypothetical protein